MCRYTHVTFDIVEIIQHLQFFFSNIFYSKLYHEHFPIPQKVTCKEYTIAWHFYDHLTQLLFLEMQAVLVLCHCEHTGLAAVIMCMSTCISQGRPPGPCTGHQISTYLRAFPDPTPPPCPGCPPACSGHTAHDCEVEGLPAILFMPRCSPLWPQPYLGLSHLGEGRA